MQNYTMVSNEESTGRTQLFKIDKATHPEPEIRLRAKATIKSVDDAIAALLHHPLFDYLALSSKIGFTPEQFCVHGRGYLEACSQVIPLFELAAARAEVQGDQVSLKILKANLDEEYGMQAGGQPDETKVHTSLARKSHHVHAQQVFGMAPAQFDATPVSAAAANYILRQRAVYEDTSYFAVIGACYVDEKGSTGMMEKYYEAFFEPYANRYASKESYDGVAEYWRAHMEELEAAHAKDIKRALLANCTTMEHIGAIKRGCEALLAEQGLLLDGVLAALKAAEKVGEPVLSRIVPVQATLLG
jgi:hypothetical protein